MRPIRALLAIAAVTLVAASCSDGATSDTHATTTTPGDMPATTTLPTSTMPADSSSSSTTSTSETPASTTTQAPLPAGLYAITFSSPASGVVALNAADGEVERQLTSDIGEGAGSLDYVPSRNSLVFSRVATAARSEVVEVAVDGEADANLVTTGYAVEVNDATGRMAVARTEVLEGGGERVVLEVHDPTGDVIASWSEETTSEEPVRPRHLAWSPDGTTLAFEIEFEDGTAVFLLDPTSENGSIQKTADAVPNPAAASGAMRSAPFWLGDGRLGVVEACCELPTFETWDVVTIDPATGEKRGTLFSLSNAPIEIDVRADGEAIALVTSHDAIGSNREHVTPRQLLTWTPTDGLRTVGEEHLTVAW